MGHLAGRTYTGTGGVEPPAPGDRGFGGGDDSGSRGAFRRASVLAVALLLAAIAMFFAAFAAAYLARRGISPNWTPLVLPGAVWTGAGLLAASSLALELARRELRRGRRPGFNRWWAVATAGGVAFLANQWTMWQRLESAGIGFTSTPAALFFYAVTVAHAAHLTAGLAALAYSGFHAFRYRLGPGRRTGAHAVSIYWHGMGVLWTGIVLLFAFCK